MSNAAIVALVVLVLLLVAAGVVIVSQHRANSWEDELAAAAELSKSAGAAVDKAEAEVERSTRLVSEAADREARRRAQKRAGGKAEKTEVARQRRASEGS